MKLINLLFALLSLLIISCSTINYQDKFNGTWQSSHKGGGNTMCINGNKLEYIARNCTGPEKKYQDIDCSINGNIITFYLPPPYDHKLKFTLKYYKGNNYLLSDSEIEQIEIKKNDYWYSRAFNKINK